MINLLDAQGKTTVTAGTTDPTDFDIVINATPMGMRQRDPLPVNTERLTSSMFVGDVITVPVLSPLLEAARALGCMTMTGSEMYDGVLELMLDFFGIRRDR